MTPRQKMFCLGYASSGNATQSAIKAGYSEKTARSQGVTLLANPNIKKELQRLSEEMRSSKIASASEMQEFLTSVIRREITEEVVVVEMCGDGVSEAVIKEKKPSFKDSVKACETLARMQGVLDNRNITNVFIPVFGGEDDLDE